jgi:predicted nuclease with TOPRIM domain
MNITEASKIMKTVALSKSKLDKKNERIKQLEAELAEAREMIACLRVTNDEYGKRSEERLSELDEAKEKYETINNLWTGLVKRSVEINKEAAEFKRQIACGELVKFKTLIEYGFFDHHTPEGQNRMEEEFQQFAAEKAKESK